jgi:hypothetical protein
MSVHLKKIVICVLVVLSAIFFCSKEQNVEKAEKMMGVKLDDATIQKLEAFMNQPTYDILMMKIEE